MSSVDQMIIFLTALFGDDLDGKYLLVWTNPGKRSAWFDNIRDAAAYAAAQQGVNVYFGICLSPEDMGSDRRCPVSSVAAMPGVWADIDIADPAAHAKENLPTTLAEAKELLASLPLPPTMTIHSGHGLQAYWLFKEPWDIDNDVERAEAATLSCGFNEMILSYAQRHGWTVDKTHDLARVFRLPGTQNVKDPANPKPVTIIEHFDERRYDPDDFPAYFPEDISAYAVDLERNKKYLDVRLTRNPVVNYLKLEDLWSIEPRAKATWMHRRRDFIKDTSLSAYDMALSAYAVQAGWTDQEIADLIIAFRMKYGAEKDIKKAFRLDYISTTITNARKKFGVSVEEMAADATITAINSKHIEENLLTEPDEEPDSGLPQTKLGSEARESPKTAARETGGENMTTCSGNDKKALLESVSAKLGVPVTRVIKYRTEPPTFAIRLGKKEVKLGRVTNLIRLGNLQTAIAESVNVMIPDKIKGWNAVAQALLNACEIVKVGDDDAGRGRVRGWIESHIEAERPSLDWEEACKSKKPYIKDGQLFIFLRSLKKHLAQDGEKFEKNEILTEIRRYGCEPETHPIRVDGKQTSRSVYHVPDSLRVSYQTAPKDSYGMDLGAEPENPDELAN